MYNACNPTCSVACGEALSCGTRGSLAEGVVGEIGGGVGEDGGDDEVHCGTVGDGLGVDINKGGGPVAVTAEQEGTIPCFEQSAVLLSAVIHSAA